eukprot:TRINITY_DN3199_c0_g1_i1.p1 TRINITY_DN3199_c0_g1~~TRINITY_DN3199_c0_g1_i1.p1  ORF type:complete len:519 (+),score=102.33 TRINITY_DN3199_c0_g1_i1:118-1674(+)
MAAVAQQTSGRESKHGWRGCNRKTAPPVSGHKLRCPKDALEQDLKMKVEEYETTAAGRERVQRCLAELQEAAKTLGPRWRISSFGSAANGFATKVSDLDATCHELPRDDGPQDDAEGQQVEQPASVLGELLAPLLRKHPQFTVGEEILRARVPILKLRFEGLEVDLSCNNTLPLHNTRLLKAYAGLDERVRQLGIVVKLWAKANHVCGASQSYLSSYSLTLMVLYFMQVYPKVHLPMIPVATFRDGSEADAEQRIQAARAAFKCNLGLGELLVKFFQFYSQEFYWGSEVVSVRLGSRLDVGQPFFGQLKARRMNRLHVEDPVDLTRNLNCVLGEPQEMRLRALMEEAFTCLTMGKALPMGYPSKQAGSQRNKLETKGRTASSVSTAADSGSSSNDEAVAEEDEAEKELVETRDGSHQHQSNPQRMAIELEHLLVEETVLQGSARLPETAAAPSPTKKHVLLKLLHGSQDLKGEPQAPQQAQGGSWTASTMPRQMSKASQSIAAKVAAACKHSTAASLQ